MSRKAGVPGEPGEMPPRTTSTVRPLPGGMSGGVRPLPGSSGMEVSADWIDVTVMPREHPAPRGRVPSPAPARSRAEVYQSGLAEHARFRESFMRWLEAHQLIGAVRAVSEPGGSLPMLHLRCSPRVLDQLRRTPEFEAGTMMPLDRNS
ncbi:hypothetical protein DRW03_19760 [Corallococcus sp. H22C18031201]|uniref:PopC secretion inhibitor PopD n=1 Tax=Citreicoccus inhibens TaxID=2849499 RepID=UPI000E73DA56|nr:hypothetical protein [Citreicoccus inhibens]MBU8900028.1 hypothetical protein [Citreicoccus inhibens]RJS20010.1 hypothetical protein DRW03_19760 [Corallococcus sp. H22C18031201]